MDFQFSRDPITQLPIARLSMEQEALGQWLSEEVSTDQVLLVEIMRYAEQVRSRAIPQWQYVGREATLLLEDGAAEIFPNRNDDELEAIEDPSLELSDWNAVTSCGVEDFIHLLRSWQSYLLA
ncbi:MULTISPECIES: YacL family protein [Corallincola]|uniref:UPF0231 family protein n=2 Tax=Corallincola TaxID=1775176 RepID=A0ABY1WNF9_9GAMM|nr:MULTISPECIES: YacL family protein [Corallincola]TAA45093.1 UPF0231 family protein [Corallincola spongiicola]TCI03627.1 UPF0231 family protein [Corallincola luteus]